MDPRRAQLTHPASRQCRRRCRAGPLQAGSFRGLGGGCNGWGSWAAHPGTDVGGFCGTRYLQARPCASQRSPQAITGQANHSSHASLPANHLVAMVNPTPGWEGPRRRQQEPNKQDRWTAIQWASAEAAESITTPPHPIQLAAVLRVQFPLATLMDERRPSPPLQAPRKCKRRQFVGRGLVFGAL